MFGQLAFVAVRRAKFDALESGIGEGDGLEEGVLVSHEAVLSLPAWECQEP